MKPIEVGCLAMIVNAKTERGRKQIGNVVTVEQIAGAGEIFHWSDLDLINDEIPSALITGNVITGVIGAGIIPLEWLMRIDGDFLEEKVEDKEIENA